MLEDVPNNFEVIKKLILVLPSKIRDFGESVIMYSFYMDFSFLTLVDFTYFGKCVSESCNRPLSLSSHVESQENKKTLFLHGYSLALNSRLGKASHAKTKLFILLRLNMATE